jgi:hypothetical protein
MALLVTLVDTLELAHARYAVLAVLHAIRAPYSPTFTALLRAFLLRILPVPSEGASYGSHASGMSGLRTGVEVRTGLVSDRLGSEGLALLAGVVRAVCEGGGEGVGTGAGAGAGAGVEIMRRAAAVSVLAVALSND